MDRNGNTRFPPDPMPQAVFRHDSGWEETVDIGSPTFDRLDKEDDWTRVDGDGDDGAVEVQASAAAVKLAETLGVDLAYVEGTGKGGSITKGDVEDAAEDGEDDGGSTD